MASIAAPPATRGSALPRAVLIEVLVVVALVLAAAAIRWPQLQILPPFTDETEESLRAWAIAQGEIRPLVNVDAYIGALWSYVVAGAFKVLGRGAEVPRLMSLVAGSLTVGVTYLLGQRLYGPVVGALAALLLAGNAAHVLVNSHVSWSNCATPLFTTTTLWLLVRALNPALNPRRGPLTPRPPLPHAGEGEPQGHSLSFGEGASLPLAGLFFGLALQTHPSVAAILVGAVVYALWRDRRLPLRPCAWLAVVLFAVGYANVLVYNLASGFDTLVQAQRVGSEYAGGSGLDGAGYVGSALGILVLIVQTAAGVVDPRLTASEYLLDPRVALMLVALVAALVWSVRQRDPLLVCLLVPVVVLVPALNQRWSPILASRYIMPLIPVAMVYLAGLIVALAERVLPDRRAAAGAALAVGALIGLVQLGGLWGYYGAEIAAGRSNDGPWRMVRLVDEQRRSREPFVVHADLHLLPTGGGGTWAKALDFLLTLEGVREDFSPRDPDRHLRSCDVQAVELRYVGTETRRPSGSDAPRHPSYWLARQTPLAGERRVDIGETLVLVPYSLPWQNRSLFDPRVPTFETGCE